jgi:undecaprenyl-phosphate 4-deoxy-4-formamido-L-arabinose transferase
MNLNRYGQSPISEGLSIVVPVYNSSETLPLLVERLRPVLAALRKPHELLLVNDASGDNSWSVISDLANQYPWIHGINLMRNFGQHNALLCGIRAAYHDRIVTMDDDLQHPPEEIPKLLERLDGDADVVYGTPQEEQHGLTRNLASRITKIALQTAMGVDAARSVSAFRAFRTELRDAFSHFAGPFVSIDVLLTWGTARFDALPVAHRERAVGASNYSFSKLVLHAMNMITGFSVLPLQIASLMGFALAGFGLLVLGYVLGRYALQGTPVPGFPFLASIISVFSGAQLLALGIVGEYLARMHFHLMGRPSYCVRLRDR